MNAMTPEEARGILASYEKTAPHYTPTPSARRALETIANMREEYGVGYTGVNHGNRHIEWHDKKKDRNRVAKKLLQAKDMHPITKHTRYVLDPEVKYG